MKKFLFALLLLSVSIGIQAQKKMPEVSVKTLDGEEVSSVEFSNDGKPMIISFWATWCKPCLNELSAFTDEFDDWHEETGVKIIAISIDDTRASARVKSLVYGKDWPFEVYLDQNQDLKRALNVVNVPHTFVLNGKGEIVWEHTSYNPGNEDEVIEQVRQLIK
ncbi:TlpA family protein disulfide reductase [Marinifilum caeruleilacunae]|uniref:TlpA family protein disulfide reductase n=1 Tax=Marinifilum caeruleilacunae TaxID=2499076 RepID=A0ABX1X109_9BACT|nr:TlpA disulfide reductase family protein [Marinifilum caeruleilacunae]NOU62097.1 TlpA family protein disulfide reductase [Marinifilum caeruleilacunae]